jgi:hypothetical protein
MKLPSCRICLSPPLDAVAFSGTTHSKKAGYVLRGRRHLSLFILRLRSAHRFSFFILHSSLFILHSSFFILHFSFSPLSRISQPHLAAFPQILIQPPVDLPDVMVIMCQPVGQQLVCSMVPGQRMYIDMFPVRIF